MAFELDHIFVAASVDAPEIQLLTAMGFTEGPPNDHPGQGTSCRRVYLENVYLELLWLTDAQAANSFPVLKTGLGQRADPDHPSSPFGFGLRSTTDPVPDPPFAIWEYSPSYLAEGAALAMGANSELLDEPLIFVLPGSRTPTWSTPEHPNGARRLTKACVVPGHSSPSEVMTAFLSLGLVSTQAGNGPLVRLELDHGVQQEHHDLRPQLPIEFSW